MSSMNPVLRRLLKAPAKLYDWRLGWLLGHRFVRLSHRGRKSGRAYQTMLEVLDRDRGTEELVVIAGLGPGADWYRNVCAGSPVEIAVSNTRFRADHRILDVEEAADVLGRYERHHRLLAPLVRLVLSRLLGWRYDGSRDARLQVAAERPIVAFRPAR